MMFKIFFGIVNDCHYDYAKIIFDDMKESVKAKRKLDSIPYHRFFAMSFKALLMMVNWIQSPTVPR